MSNTNSAPLELGTEKIGKLLSKYALPAIIAMIASSLYNMVDSIYIGQGVGTDAISGLAVTFPLMNLSTAFGTLVGVGGATMLSILLGQKKYNDANKVLSNVLTLNIIIGVLFMVVSLAWLDPILYFFGASEVTIEYARDYIQIILAGNTITHVYFGLNAAMRATGNPKMAMSLTLFTVIFNSILDPIMIFGLDMGIAGAAWATVIAQAVAMVITVDYFCHKKRPVHMTRTILSLDMKIAKDSLSIGFGPFLMHTAACMVALFINQQMRKYSGDIGLGAYGICNRLGFMFIMVCMGFNQGMQPIAGYNFGARKYSRVKEVFWMTAKLATLVVAVFFIVAEFFPSYAVSIFTHDPQLIALSARGMRLQNLVVFIIGFQIVSTHLFQSLGMVNKSIFLSLSRQVLCLLPALYLLPLKFGADGVWLSYPASDAIAFVITAIMLSSLLKKFNKMKDGDDPSSLGGRI